MRTAGIYHEFNNYCQYKAYDNAKILALLKVLLKDNASLWYMPDTRDTGRLNVFESGLLTALTHVIRPMRSGNRPGAKQFFTRKAQKCKKPLLLNFSEVTL